MHLIRFKTSANHKQDSNHAPDLVPQKSSTSNFNGTKLIVSIPASKISNLRTFGDTLTMHLRIFFFPQFMFNRNSFTIIHQWLVNMRGSSCEIYVKAILIHLNKCRYRSTESIQHTQHRFLKNATVASLASQF